MILSKVAQKLNQLIQSTNARTTQPLSLLLRDSPRHFSTGIDHQSPPPFAQQPSNGLVYGRLLGISSNTLKTDIINMFGGCKLTLDDIKVDYNRLYYPMAMLLQFRSYDDFGAAFRELTRKSRSIRLEKVVDNQQWDLLTPYNGRYVVFRGLSRNVLMEDVERFLCGCNYESLEMFTRPTQSEPIRIAKARFPSQIEALNAVIKKNGAFCLNARIEAQLIQ